MAERTDCTLSDICIDYFVKNNFRLYIERAGDRSVNEWEWIAKRTDLHLYATDPIRLIALYMIQEDWINDEKYYKNGEIKEDYISAFVGNCQSQELLENYMYQEYELLNGSRICSAFGFDFHISYDKECLMATLNAQQSNDVREIFADIAVIEPSLLEQDYPHNLDKSYNVAIAIKKMKYEGKREEIVNDKFGRFRFLGTYRTRPAECIADAGNTCKYAVSKLKQWGYTVSETDDSVEFSGECNICIAKKDKKVYSATDPLRLLGFIAMIREYGEDWESCNVARAFSIKPVKEQFYWDL